MSANLESLKRVQQLQRWAMLSGFSPAPESGSGYYPMLLKLSFTIIFFLWLWLIKKFDDYLRAILNRSGPITGKNDDTIFLPSQLDPSVSAQVMSSASLDRKPLRGALNIVLVLVDFQDVKMAAGAEQRFQDLFFSHGKIPTGSVTEYFEEVSRGKISLVGDILGPITLREKMAYYADGKYGYENLQPNTMTIAGEAIIAATGKTNFNKYDNDGNGMIDAFIIVHAGPGAENTKNKDHIWSTNWTFDEKKSLNDVSVCAFLIIPEDAKIGICVHELGHKLFGWPDLYDKDGTSQGIGSWCSMSHGCWSGGGDRPVHPSLYCKANQGWIEVVNETENHEIVLEDVNTGGKAHRLWTNGDTNSKEYFLIENRQRSGFDASLPGDGLLIWHIDTTISGNRDEVHPRVRLVQADGLNELKFNLGDAGVPYPGLTNNTTFNATSNPNSKAYSGQDSLVSISKIPSSSPSMKLNITVKKVEPPLEETFDPRKWYRITNAFAGHALDVVNDGCDNAEGLLQMSRLRDSSGQYWQIVSNGSGTYTLRTLFLGAERRLDVYGNDKKKPHLGNAVQSSGQQWTIKSWGDGTWHLENSYSGTELFLDTMEGGPRVALYSANVRRPTQRWSIKPIRAITETGF